MPRDLDLDFEFQDEEVRERPVRPAPRREVSGGRGGSRGGAASQKLHGRRGQEHRAGGHGPSGGAPHS